MSTVAEKLKYQWVAYFENKDVLVQPEDDRYSKHDEAADHNPSAFRDILDKQEKGHELHSFHLMRSDDDLHRLEYSVDLRTGIFTVKGRNLQLHPQNTVPADLKLIFFREVRQETIGGVTQPPFVNKYFMGWEGVDMVTGEKLKQTIGID